MSPANCLGTLPLFPGTLSGLPGQHRLSLQCNRQAGQAQCQCRAQLSMHLEPVPAWRGLSSGCDQQARRACPPRVPPTALQGLSLQRDQAMHHLSMSRYCRSSAQHWTLQSLPCRDYRGDVTSKQAERFISMLNDLEEKGTVTPVIYDDGISYIYVQYSNLYLLAVARNNCNVSRQSAAHPLSSRSSATCQAGAILLQDACSPGALGPEQSYAVHQAACPAQAPGGAHVLPCSLLSCHACPFLQATLMVQFPAKAACHTIVCPAAPQGLPLPAGGLHAALPAQAARGVQALLRGAGGGVPQRQLCDRLRAARRGVWGAARQSVPLLLSNVQGLACLHGVRQA